MNRWCWSAGTNGAVAHAIAVAPCWCSTLVLAATFVGAATAVAVVVVVIVAIEPMTMGARGRPKVNACGRLCLGGGLTVAEKNADVALQLRGGGRGDLGDGSRQKCLVENATKAIKNLADPLPGDCACIIFEAASKSGEVLLSRPIGVPVHRENPSAVVLVPNCLYISILQYRPWYCNTRVGVG